MPATGSTSTIPASDSITVPHAAALAGVTIPHMQQLIRTGQIEGWRDGQQWKTTRQAVEAYLRKRSLSRSWAAKSSRSAASG